MERCELTLWAALDDMPTVSYQALARPFRGMLAGIAAVHSAGVVHRDIKPDNFICTARGRTVKLCDFGLAGLLCEDVVGLTGIYGTAPFLSPEMLKKLAYGTKTDVWSLG